MKSRITTFAFLGAVAALAVCSLFVKPAVAADQFNEGPGNPKTLFSYGSTGSGSYYQQYGTNNASGWTNTTGAYFDLAGKSSASFFVRAAMYSNAPANCVLVVKPAFGSATNDLGSATVGDLPRRIQLLFNGTSYFQTITNITGLYCPGVQVFFENPAVNESITNLTIKAVAKTP